MNHQILKIFVLMSILGLSSCKGSVDPATWSDEKVNQWFEKSEWLGGWDITPDESINRREFAISYYNHQERWDKVFKFLKDNDLSSLELKRYDIDGTEVYAPVSEYMSKSKDVARYEAHKKYIDLQYVISGKELIGVAPMSALKEVTEEYNETKDIFFMTVNNPVERPANPDRFFLFFPDDLHCPGMMDGDSTMVKKVVVKILVD